MYMKAFDTLMDIRAFQGVSGRSKVGEAIRASVLAEALAAETLLLRAAHGLDLAPARWWVPGACRCSDIG